MRLATCQALVDLYKTQPFVFLTGDLGFMALESLRDVMGERFINAGVAEQNMVSVAGGLARGGLQAWAYSIAPFIYARPFEQIRNDVCLHNFDVKLIGNGGGYGYGSMGSTHHALEDYGVMLALQHMRVFVPAFAADLPLVIPKMAQIKHPVYLRLGRCEKPADFALPPYAPWRKLLAGSGPVLLVVGPLAGGIINPLLKMEPAKRPEVWVLSELPLILNPIPEEFRESLKRTRSLCVAEEHVLQGSVGQILAHWILQSGLEIKNFTHAYAKGYVSGYYGSQVFHRQECGLDTASILKLVSEKGC